MGKKFKTITRRFCYNQSLPRALEGKINIKSEYFTRLLDYFYSEEGTELSQRKYLVGPALTDLGTSGKTLPVESATNKGETILEIT